jgi:hypothetical protein
LVWRHIQIGFLENLGVFIFRLKYFFWVVFMGLTLIFQMRAHALEADYMGQLSGWINGMRIQGEWEKSAGLQYFPQADFVHRLNEASTLDAELSLYCLASIGTGPYEEDLDVDLYRANIRYNTNQIETRAGLQKINFGQATLLRPLRWFDRVDPTDPLQSTEGVYALRFRYDALNSANFWIWTLYGNDDIKGYERLPTEPDTIETGGRFQYPIFHGDLAVTAHTRKVDGSDYGIPDFRENRMGLDGRWDVFVGLWFETSLVHQNTDYLSNNWTKRSTVGLDYTFDMGNGLYVLAEHMIVALSEKALEWNENYNISAFSMRYPIGLLDSVRTIGYYDWDRDYYYQYLDWTRTYDNVMINVSLFYYPDGWAGNGGFNQNSRYMGSGGQLLITFNH